MQGSPGTVDEESGVSGRDGMKSLNLRAQKGLCPLLHGLPHLRREVEAEIASPYQQGASGFEQVKDYSTHASEFLLDVPKSEKMKKSKTINNAKKPLATNCVD